MSEQGSPIPDIAARESALNPRDSFIVQAPAGSGKTYLLAKRYVELLAVVNRPEEILAITFTRKAAGEMRHRVMEFLLEDDSTAKNARKRNETMGWQLFENPNVLKIQTIDSFALEVASQIPHLANAAGLSITQNAQAFYTQASQRLLDRLYQNDPVNPLVSEFLAFLDNDAQRVNRLVSTMLSRRDQWLDAIIAVAGERHTNKLTELLSLAINHLRQEVTEELTQHLTAHDRQMLGLIADELGIENELDMVLPRLLSKQGKLLKQLTKRQQVLDGDLVKASKPWLAELQQRKVDAPIIRFCALPHVVDAQSDQDMTLLKTCCICMSLAAAELEQLFLEANTLDFTGVLIRAKQALQDESGPTNLALYLDYRINHFLVDEYQDTSQAQFAFFNLLTQGWAVDQGNTFFAVGDPMQSIYRFRDADVAIFGDTTRHGLNDVRLAPIQLQANFRSDPAVVSWCNTLFANIFGTQQTNQLGDVAFCPAIAMKPEPNTAVGSTTQCLQFDDAIAETQFLVKHIQTLLDTDSTGEIAILCRARGHIQHLLEALKAQRIAFAATDMDPLAETPIIQDLMSLHASLLDNANQLAHFSVLRSPMFGLTLTELTDLQQQQDSVTINLEDSAAHPAVTRFANALSWARNKLYESPLREILEGLWFRCGGADAYPEEQWRHAIAWFELIDELQQDAYDGQLLASAIGALFAASDASARVKVMTIHKSKGLEFDHVILPFLDRSSRADQAQLVQWRPTQHGLLMGVQGHDVHDWLTFEERERASNEEKRLLYVACTRAVHSLTTSFSCEANKSPGGLAKWLSDQAQHQPMDAVEHEIPTALETAQLRRLSNTYQWVPPTYTPLAGPANNDRRQASDELSEKYEVALGILVHQALAWFTGQSGREWLAENPRFMEADGPANSGKMSGSQDDHLDTRLNHWLSLLPTPTENHPNLKHEAKQHIANTLSNGIGMWILKPHQVEHSEWPMSGIIENDLVRIVIDRIFVDENTCWIVDFKTSHPRNDEPPEVFMAREANQYKQQLSQYASIASDMFDEPIKQALFFTSIGRFYEMTVGVQSQDSDP